jgi:hypothetical protein
MKRYKKKTKTSRMFIANPPRAITPSRVEDIYLNQLMVLRDPAEGMSAFLEKRTPAWKHR